MSLQARLSRRIENSRRRNAKKVLMSSPEKNQCISCGRFVVAGPMGLSRHHSTHPQCSLDYSKVPSSLSYPSVHGEMDASHCHHQTNGSFHATSPVSADVNNDCISSLAFNDEEDFGTSTFTDVEDNEMLLTIGDSAMVSNNPYSSISLSASEIGDAPSFSTNNFYDPWSKVHDDDLDLLLSSVGEKVQIDLLETLKKLKVPMIAYDKVMKWAVRSSSKGHVFCDMPITSRKTIMDKLCGRVGLDSLTPLVKELYLPYSNCHVEVVYFCAHAVFSSFLSSATRTRTTSIYFMNPTTHTSTHLQNHPGQFWVTSIIKNPEDK